MLEGKNMEKIIKQTGEGLLYAICILGIIFIFFNVKYGESKGILSILGNASDIESRDYSAYEDVITTEKIVAQEATLVKFDDTGLDTIKKHQEVELLKYFRFSTEDGTYVESSEYPGRIEIMVISNLLNEDCTYLYQTDIGKITFPDSGIYKVKFRIKDTENKVSNAKINIAVQ